jgi:hypothetical protein
VVGVAILLRAQVGHAQQSPAPSPNPAPPIPLASYRPPALALVQPAAGGSVPQDRPVVVFRFAAGEPNDPIDVGSFLITVDAHNRTALFQVTAGEAWGPLAPPATASTPPITEGSHQVAARICSSRGACSETAAAIVVTSAPLSQDQSADRKRKVVDVLLDLARKLLKP